VPGESPGYPALVLVVNGDAANPADVHVPRWTVTFVPAGAGPNAVPGPPDVGTSTATAPATLPVLGAV